jgi:hypothetical protein
VLRHKFSHYISHSRGIFLRMIVAHSSLAHVLWNRSSQRLGRNISRRQWPPQRQLTALLWTGASRHERTNTLTRDVSNAVPKATRARSWTGLLLSKQIAFHDLQRHERRPLQQTR